MRGHLTGILSSPDQLGERGNEREKVKLDRRGRVRERGCTFSLDFSTTGPSFLAKQEGKSFLVTRPASRDQNRGVSTNSKR